MNSYTYNMDLGIVADGQHMFFNYMSNTIATVYNPIITDLSYSMSCGFQEKVEINMHIMARKITIEKGELPKLKDLSEYKIEELFKAINKKL